MTEIAHPEGYTFSTPGIPIEALRQDVMWFDRDGNQHEIATMNRFHARNAYKKLVNAYGVYGARSLLGQGLRRAMGNGR